MRGSAIRGAWPHLADHASEFPAQCWQRRCARTRALIAGIAAYRRHPWQRDTARSAGDLAGGRQPAAGLWRRRARRAVRAQPGQPRLCAGPGAGPLDAALARGQRRAAAAAGLGLAGRGGAALHPDRLHRRAAGAGDGGAAVPGPVGAGRLLHGRAAGGGGGAAPAGPGQRPGAAGHPVGFSCRRPGSAPRRRPKCCRCWSRRWRFASTLPIDALQALFAMLDPYGSRRQIPRLCPRSTSASERADLFVALEDWLNDGVPLAAPVARECLARLVRRQHAGAGGMAGRGPAGRSGRAALPAFVAVPGARPASCRRNPPGRWPA